MPSRAPAPAGPRPPARLDRQARLAQLLGAAMPLAARGGPTALRLEAVAARAGVTRNLLYHYFPRGRADLVLAVVSEAERQLSAPESSPEDPLAGLLDHGLAPTHAWRIHRWASGLPDPEIRAVLARGLENLVLALSEAHLQTRRPAPLARAGLLGYVAFVEAVLEQGRAAALTRSELSRLLGEVLVATLDGARR